jgi:predicted Fe-Mo cluster-binding NifX family protein
MIVCVPVTTDGQVDPRWGRAARVAVAEVASGEIASWQEMEVGWDTLHDQGTEGGHHARVARFLLDNGVQAVVAGHMGAPMSLMLQRMQVIVHVGAGGDAREAVLAATGAPEAAGPPA